MMEKAGSLELFVILGGVIALLLLRVAPGGYVAPVVERETEVWGTPYYLRYNTPVMDNRQAILPRASPWSFGLGVPSSSVATGIWGIGSGNG